MTKTISIAGLGAATRQIHLPAYAKIPSLKVVGGYDQAMDCSSFSFPLFGSVDELLDRTRPDIFAVITPPNHHYDLVCQGLEFGCHVICEKPFVESMEQAKTIVELAKKSEKRVVINNQYRFMNTYREAKRRIGSAEFGDLLFLCAEQTFHRTSDTEAGWRGQDPRRTCKEFGTHVFDLCRFFFNEDPVAVTARMPRANQSGGPDLLNLIQLEFSGDRVAQVTLDRLSRGPHRYLDLRLDGSNGCIETRFGGTVELRAGIRGRTRRPYIGCDFALGGSADLIQGERVRRIARNPLDAFAHGTSGLIQEFLKALDNGHAPPCDAEDNCRTLALMLAAYESADERKRIELCY